MSAWLSLTILLVVIFHIYTAATESISSLDTMAIYDGLLAPENIIGTNLQVTKTIVYGPSRSSFCLSLAFCVDHLSINPTKRRVQQCTTRTIAKLLRKNPPESSQFELWRDKSPESSQFCEKEKNPPESCQFFGFGGRLGAPCSSLSAAEKGKWADWKIGTDGTCIADWMNRENL